MDTVNVKFVKLNENAVVPTYAKEGDFAMDLTAVSVEFDTKTNCNVYHTGLAVEIPKGYGMLIFPRSSNRNTNDYMPNSVGVVDSGYRGEVLVSFKNRDSYRNNPPYKVGDRIAQIAVIPYPKIHFVEVEELEPSDRGEGGHGSTGE